jgi:hypothetical protein
MPYLLLFQRAGHFGFSPLLSAEQGFCARPRLGIAQK